MDIANILVMVIEGAIIVAFCILNGYELYKRYKNKSTLSIDDITSLIKDLNNLASTTMDLVAPYKLTRKDFGTDEEYRDYLSSQLIADFDKLIDKMGLTNTPDNVYKNLSYIDKKKIVDVVLDKFDTTSTDIVHEEPSKSDDSSESNDVVDIGDQL